MKEKINKLLAQVRQQRRMLTLLPLICIPFLCFLFWALKGGAAGSEKTLQDSTTGLLQLPHSNLPSQKGLSKWAHYRQEEPDVASENEGWDSLLSGWEKRLGSLSAPDYDSSATLQQLSKKQALYQQLDELDRSLYSAQDLQHAARVTPDPHIDEPRVLRKSSALVAPALQAQGRPSADDPELRELNGMLDKILQIQQPQLAQEHSEELASLPDRQFANQDVLAATLIKAETQDTLNSNGFFSSEFQQQSRSNSVLAVIHQKQTVRSGSTVTLRLLGDLQVGATHLPSGSLVYGMAQLADQRLHIRVSQLRSSAGIQSVKLVAHDLDGLTGLYLPALPALETLKGQANQSLQSLGWGQSMESTLAVQAAEVGLGAAKSLLSSQTKSLKVQLQPDYQLLLKNEQNEK